MLVVGKCFQAHEHRCYRDTLLPGDGDDDEVVSNIV